MVHSPLPLPPAPASVSASSTSLAQSLSYGASPQQRAVQLDDDGCGFCYYESGRLAACINKVNAYQRTFQFYEDNAAKTLLATFDQHAIGSAGRPKGMKLLLTKDGGIIMDATNQITKNWRWDPKAQKAGTPPHESVVIPLNDALLFTYKDRHSISMKFTPSPGIAVLFDCGERLRRMDTYLDHAHRATQGAHRGKLLIDQDVPTLQQRQKQIECESLEKRSKQKPRSQDLAHDQIKRVVATLETKFDGYQGCQVTPAADGNWKESARLQSLLEIPMLAKTGTEVGNEPTLLGSPVQPHDAQSALERLKHAENGKWLGSVEVHDRILQENPSLARKGALSIASGRYSRELPVSGYVNGRKPAITAHLPLISTLKLDAYLHETCTKDELVCVACLRTDDPQSCAMELLLEQVQSRLLKDSAAEHPPSTTSTGTSMVVSKCRLVKCDLAESSHLADRYQIHAAPTFLIFFDARLVHVSSLGGVARRVFPATTNAHLSNQVDVLPRVLLVEKHAKQQVAIEKVLRKEAFQWDLALSGEQAVAFFSRLPLRGAPRTSSSASSPSPSITLSGSAAATASTSYGLVLVSDTLDDSELRAIDRLVRSKDKAKSSASSSLAGTSSSLVCAVVSSPQADIQFASSMCLDCRKAHGRRISSASSATKKPTDTALACPHCGIISAEIAATVVSPVMTEIAHVIVYKHIKAATLHRLAETWIARTRTPHSVLSSSSSSSSLSSGSLPPQKLSTDEHHTGLTVDSFFREMERYYATAKRGVFLPDGEMPEMALSVRDVVLPATTAAIATNTVVHQTRSSSA